MKTYNSISDYIADQPDADDRKHLERIRKTILDAAPGAEETISYGMPAFKLNGALIYFANAKQHFGIYPMPSAIQYFAARLKNYKSSKGAIQLPKSAPLDLELIRDITEFRVKENLEKPYGKNKTARK